MSSWNDRGVTACVRHCLRHSLRVLLFFVFISVIVNATPHFLDDNDISNSLEDIGEVQIPDKRPARLSYFRAPYKSGRGRYGFRGSHRSYGYMMPWDSLPNTNCLRKYCRDDRDCCRRFSKCNKRAHVCYDCWYGHPCRTHYDCCAQYPYCSPVLNTCGK